MIKVALPKASLEDFTLCAEKKRKKKKHEPVDRVSALWLNEWLTKAQKTEINEANDGEKKLSCSNARCQIKDIQLKLKRPQYYKLSVGQNKLAPYRSSVVKKNNNLLFY